MAIAPEPVIIHRAVPSWRMRDMPAPYALTRSVAIHAAAVLMVVALFAAVFGVLDDDAVIWVVTPLRLLLGTAFVALLVSGPLTRTYGSALDVPLALLLLAAGYGTHEATPGLAPWRWLFTLVLAYYVTVGLRRRYSEAGPTLVLVALILVACTSVVALHQAAAHISSGFCGSGFEHVDCTAPGADIRVGGTFGNPNLLAAFLVLLLPLAAVAAWRRDAGMRLIACIVTVGGIVAVLLTWSRAGWIGLLAALLVAGFQIGSQRRLVGRGIRLGAMLLLLAAVAASLAVGVGVRNEVWRAALATAYHHPLGVGLGKAGAYISYRIPGTVQYAHAHNMWLNWLVEAGILGFLAVCAVTVLVALRMRRAMRTGDPGSVAVGAGLTGFAVMCLADHPANVTSIAIPFAVMLGLAMTCDLPYRGRRIAR